MDSITTLVTALVAALLFPFLVIIIYRHRQRRHNRAMGRRRTQKIEL